MCESGRWLIKLWRPEACKLAETLHFKGTLSVIKGLRTGGRDRSCTDDYLLRRPKAVNEIGQLNYKNCFRATKFVLTILLEREDHGEQQTQHGFQRCCILNDLNMSAYLLVILGLGPHGATNIAEH